MGTNSIIGYSAAGVGLAVIAFSTKIAPMLSFLGTKSMIYTIMAGVVLVAGGPLAVAQLGRGVHLAPRPRAFDVGQAAVEGAFAVS